MSWVRIDDHFYDHPRWATAPGDSIALWVAAMAWCNRNDSFHGHIPKLKLAGLVNVRNVKATTTDLVERGALVATDQGYTITSYEEYQQNDRVKAIREARQEAGRKGAAARWGSKPDGNSDGNCHGNEDAPPPTTRSVVVETGSDDDGNPRKSEVLDLYASIGMDAATKRGVKIGSPPAYKAKLRRSAASDPEVDRLLALFPTAPPSAVVAALYGNKSSLNYFPRADELPDDATVTELRTA